MNQSSYSHKPHAENCACSVCWSKAEMARSDPCPSTPCALCRRASALPIRVIKMGFVAGAWKVLLSDWAVTPAFICEKHTPPLQPPKYWRVVQDSGAPIPSLPPVDLFYDF
ncbi:DUF5447 family protein [Pseudomonas sp. LPB0260]|uniref:lysogeny maintenance protein PflM n=1 Tax=Pseudomonas sp. LPB0260 TaxID=2614442 RepID=UPI0015C293CA|nr:DUF5447 family protein [Pseudomonas sp. LPB0260]QLC73843.1 DUF5447 family protein [Pseudomonas sp. LPB0260]QLC76617.1 DUF5447 family protein [Pseudomonas sp. LPB0260]